MSALATAVAIASMIAGHPTQVVCDATNPTFAPGHDPNGWAYVGGNEVHLQPRFCEGLALKPANDEFVVSLGLLIHESAHARGVSSEACAEMYANVLIYDIMHRYYNVPMFTKASWNAGWVLHVNAPFPAEYQWSAASCDDQP